MERFPGNHNIFAPSIAPPAFLSERKTRPVPRKVAARHVELFCRITDMTPNQLGQRHPRSTPTNAAALTQRARERNAKWGRVSS